MGRKSVPDRRKGQACQDNLKESKEAGVGK
jgi:hypothetical protein